ncbi:MAG TPA: pitrilysin family protein [Gemmatimonadales bacterium]
MNALASQAKACARWVTALKRSAALGAGFSLCIALQLVAQVPDRSKPPQLAPPPALSLPPIAQHTLSNGLRVFVLEKHQVPVVQVNLVVKAGSANDPDGKTGLASMIAVMLDEGAGSRNALELADAVDFLGAQLSASAEPHVTTLALHSPVARLDSALGILADVALRPSFSAEELERQRRQRLTALAQQHDEPRIVAGVQFARALYGEGHPYGRRAGGVEQSVRSFTVDDLRGFHGTWFRPGNAALVVVGDVRAASVLPMLEASFGRWEGGATPAPRWGEAPQVRRRAVSLVDKPGAAQTEVVIGRIGVPRSTADYYALVVMNTILGGSFTSRLNNNLREDKGYTYGASSSFAFDRLAGPFSARASVHTAVTDKALTEFFKELRGIRERVPAEELERAKNFVALRFPERFETVSSVARQLGELYVYDLPADYYDQYTRRILAVTAADVQRVARQYVDPERVTVVLVGDRSKIEAGVRALRLGSIQTLTVEQVLGPVPVVAVN